MASHSQIIAARKCDLPKNALCAKIRENSGDTILLHESPAKTWWKIQTYKKLYTIDNSTGATIMKTCQKTTVKLLLQENKTTLVQPEQFSKADTALLILNATTVIVKLCYLNWFDSMAHTTSLFPNSLFDNQSDIRSIFNILQTFEKTKLCRHARVIGSQSGWLCNRLLNCCRVKC